MRVKKKKKKKDLSWDATRFDQLPILHGDMIPESLHRVSFLTFSPVNDLKTH